MPAIQNRNAVISSFTKQFSFLLLYFCLIKIIKTMKKLCIFASIFSMSSGVLAGAENIQSQNMSFEECKYVRGRMISDFGIPSQDVVRIVETNIMTTTRICLKDGSMLITCSRPDNKMVLTKSDGRGGCSR